MNHATLAAMAAQTKDFADAVMASGEQTRQWREAMLAVRDQHQQLLKRLKGQRPCR